MVVVGCAANKFWLFYILSAVACGGWKNANVPKCAAGCGGSAANLCLQFWSLCVRCQRVSGNFDYTKLGFFSLNYLTP